MVVSNRTDAVTPPEGLRPSPGAPPERSAAPQPAVREVAPASGDVARALEMMRAATRRPVERAAEPVEHDVLTPGRGDRFAAARAARTAAAVRGRVGHEVRPLWRTTQEPSSGIILNVDGTYRPTTLVLVRQQLKRLGLRD